MCWSLAIALGKVGGLKGLQAVVPTTQTGVSEALTIIVGTFISGGTQATNWSRFANSGRTAFLGTLAAFFRCLRLCCLWWCFLLPGLWQRRHGAGDGAAVVKVLGFGAAVPESVEYPG